MGDTKKGRRGEAAVRKIGQYIIACPRDISPAGQPVDRTGLSIVSRLSGRPYSGIFFFPERA